MPEFVTKMSTTSFVMRIPTEEKMFLEVTITGKGLKFDTKTGELLAGQVADIALTSFVQNGKKFLPMETQKISGINYPADKIAEIFGNHFWNHTKFVAEVFDKMAGLHEDISHSYFSKDKSYSWGSEGNNKIVGSAFADHIDGNGGDDQLNGGIGNDHIVGGKGNDTLGGDSGDDWLFDSEGNNRFVGGTGNDWMRGGTGDDFMTGGAGKDVFYGKGGTDRFEGGAGVDSFVFNAKEAGKITISDFGKTDILVNALTGNGEEAYKDFMEHAHQVGKNVVYENGELQLTLMKCDLKMFEAGNFGSAEKLAEFIFG